ASPPAAAPCTGEFTTVAEYEAAMQARRDREAELTKRIEALSERMMSLRRKAAATDARALGEIGVSLGETGLRLQMAQDDLTALQRLPMPSKIAVPRSVGLPEREAQERAAVLGG